jgi:receptor protein-tyrosine kinase
MLRANLRYFNVDHTVRSVVVTSVAPGDGKSTVAWNLAFAAAGAGSRVLLIEADLRHPSLAASAGHLRRAPGLSTVLSGSDGFTDAVQEVPVGRTADGALAEHAFDVLVAGPIPPNPVDLIDSQRMRDLLNHAESTYDLVVIDTPPIAVVSDAVPLLKEVSGVLVVIRLERDTRDAVAHLRDQLENLDAPTLGVVANGLKMDRTAGYGYGYGYGPERNGGATSAAADPAAAGARSSAADPEETL